MNQSEKPKKPEVGSDKPVPKEPKGLPPGSWWSDVDPPTDDFLPTGGSDQPEHGCGS